MSSADQQRYAASMALLPLTGFRDATGALRDVYVQLMQRPLPNVYRPAHGDAPGIIRAHSLDAAGMGHVFRFSGMLNGQGPLTWPERELVNATTSQLNQCFY
jgi:hypothetical protein